MICWLPAQATRLAVINEPLARSACGDCEDSQLIQALNFVPDAGMLVVLARMGNGVVAVRKY